MPARPFRFARVPRQPLAMGAFAVVLCLLGYGVAVGQPWWQATSWGILGLLLAVQLLRRPVTRLRLDAAGLTARQGRKPARHFPRDQIAGLHLIPEPRGPGLLNVQLVDGRIEALTLLTLPPRAALARAAKSHGLAFEAH